ARRVLADDGTCWLNLGDSYSASSGGATGLHAYLGPHITTHRVSELPAKNLLGLPWRVAFALQDDGWILRNAIVWHKPNAMPESVRDRLNCRYELIFLFVKSGHYWFDLDPIRVPHAPLRPARPGPAPAGRTSPRSPSTSPPAASRPAANPAAPSSTRSAAPAPPAWPPSNSGGSSPASNSTRPLPPLPPNASGIPSNLALARMPNDRHH